MVPPRGSTTSPVVLLVTSLAANCRAARSLVKVFLRLERSGIRHCTSYRTPALVSRRLMATCPPERGGTSIIGLLKVTQGHRHDPLVLARFGAAGRPLLLAAAVDQMRADWIHRSTSARAQRRCRLLSLM